MEKSIELNLKKSLYKMGESMKNITNYEEINPLLRKYFKRGLLTNHFMNEEEYKYTISQNKLSFHEWNGGNIFLNQKDEFYKLTYQLLNLEHNLDVKLPDKTVIEITKKYLDSDFDRIVDYWKTNGFNEVLSRVRLSQEKSKEDILTIECEDVKISVCKPEELCRVKELLCENFNQYTGCIPNSMELENFLKAGFILGAYVDNVLVGILHFSVKRGSSEIKHLCINKEFRKKKIASALISKYHNEFAEKRKYVWCARDNDSARNLYKKFGYNEDGCESIVLTNFHLK